MNESKPSPESAAVDPTESEPTDATVPDRLEHVEMTANKLIGGATFDEVTAELISVGWEPAAAESIVEEAREATKRERGVRTREDVVIGVSRKFGKTMRRVRWLIIIGVVIVAIAIWMMMNRGE